MDATNTATIARTAVGDELERQERVLAENGALPAFTSARLPDATSIGALALTLTTNPLAFALRMLNLEAYVRQQDREIGALKQQVSGLAGREVL
jgi:hypothetical protein